MSSHLHPRVPAAAPAIAAVMLVQACSDGAASSSQPASASASSTAPTISASSSPTAAPVRQAGALTVVAELVDRGPQLPGCGILHVRQVMRYRVRRVLDGDIQPGAELFVIHGCPEMERSMYAGPNAGNLDAFRQGEYHLLSLRLASPEAVAEATDSFSEAPGPRYSTLRADAAPGEVPK